MKVSKLSFTLLLYLLEVSFLSILFPIEAKATTDFTIIDGDFSSWIFGAIDTATVTREPTDGNPDARINITTVSGPGSYGTAIKSDFSTSLPLDGLAFSLALDVLSGPGAFGQGQEIYLLIEQNGTIYGTNLDRTGYPVKLEYTNLYWYFHCKCIYTSKRIRS